MSTNAIPPNWFTSNLLPISCRILHPILASRVLASISVRDIGRISVSMDSGMWIFAIGVTLAEHVKQDLHVYITAQVWMRIILSF